MSLAFKDLERILGNEQKKCDDHLVIGGLEKFINNFTTKQHNAERARAEQVEQALRGYGAAEPEARREMIERALAALRDETPPAPVVEDEPPAAPTPEPPDEFDDEDDEDEAPGTPKKPRVRAPMPPPGFGLDASVTRLQSIGPAHAKKLQKLGVYTVGDLLYHFPHRYDDYSQLKTISQLVYGEEVTLLVTVCEAHTRETHRAGLTITTVLLADTTGKINATFFNQPYLQQQFKSGRRIVISGRVDQDLGHLSFKRPEWEPISKELVHTARIVPVYPLTEGITSRWLRRLIKDIVEYWAPKAADALPTQIRARANLLDVPTALSEIHFPTTPEKMAAARRRLALDEFLLIQLGVLRQRKQWRDQPGRALRADEKLQRDFLESLPFQLTNAQQRVLQEILGDIQRAQPMSRLLQGDVGSGKTVVAAAAMLTAMASGAQAALLAPT
ncbi:MAG: hypothetical protein L0Y55_18815, partial [Anaerolineales bacterium]|nr:hypothetical protein [Anaerolineales bacterium]